jgi:hypothetical protein
MTYTVADRFAARRRLRQTGRAGVSCGESIGRALYVRRFFNTAAVTKGLSNGVSGVEISTTGTTRQRQSAISRDHPTETDVTIPPITVRLTRSAM